ncbi:MAG: phosphodiester glycosidase family protein [Eubacterium sp.]|nr:phosphodiester glycosidase family protein [Eubacterium sp.]
MVYVADIQLKNLGLLKSGLANDSFGRNVTEATSDIAERLDAILAVNGDFYGFRDTGYVIRNGVLYRSEKKSDDAQDLVLWSDGTMEVIREGDITAEELLERGALQVYSFGPGLVEDGEITVNASSEVGQAMLSNPRTAIGMIEPMHYVMVVSDGRTTESEGLSLLQLAQIMQDLGCTTAYNLDGGGSTTMYFNGEVINNPTSGRKSSSERSVSDIVYIGY